MSAAGWQHFPPDAEILRWREAAIGLAELAIAASCDWRCGGTWCPGVDALPNGPDGAVGDAPLGGAAVAATGWRGTWHRAQVSCCRPGYPRRDPTESDAQHRFRARRDAAHLDGLLPVGPSRLRMLREPHAFILGIGMRGGSARAAPLVVWDGSHRIMGTALGDALRVRTDRAWADVDLTAIYQAARRKVFETCRRVEIPLTDGAAVLLHRHLLHGIAPWDADTDGPDLRMTAYFRPQFSDLADWIGSNGG